MSSEKQLQCLLCGRDIKILEQFVGGSFLLNDAGFVHIDFGYGSGFDTDRAKAFICDECFGKDEIHARLHTHTKYELFNDYMKATCDPEAWKEVVMLNPHLAVEGENYCKSCAVEIPNGYKRCFKCMDAGYGEGSSYEDHYPSEEEMLTLFPRPDGLGAIDSL